MKHPGAKWSIAQTIVQLLPEHDVYCEPYFGSGAILFNKPSAISEIVNDIDDTIVAFFETLREEPEALARAAALTPWSRTEWVRAAEPAGGRVEVARRLLVRTWQSHGHRPGNSGWRHNGPTRDDHSVVTTWQTIPARIHSAAERLRKVQIECRPALDVIRRYRGKNVLLFVDAPYLGSTRKGKRIYKREMMEAADHQLLLQHLLEHPGPVALTHYRCPLYDEMLRGWAVIDIKTVAEHGQRRVDALYLNSSAVVRLKVERRYQPPPAGFEPYYATLDAFNAT